MTLLELMQLIKEKWYLVVIFPIVFALATAAYCWGVMPNEYTASTQMYVLAKNTSAASGQSVSYTELTASQQIAKDLAVLVKSQKVLKASAQELGVDDLDAFKITVSNKDSERVITLSVTGKNPEDCARVANTIAKQMSTAAVQMMDVDSVNNMDQAQAPENPSGPKRLQYTLIALLAGLFVAVALIVLLDMVNTRVRTSEEAEEEFGLPVIGRMPEVKEMK